MTGAATVHFDSDFLGGLAVRTIDLNLAGHAPILRENELFLVKVVVKQGIHAVPDLQKSLECSPCRFCRFATNAVEVSSNR